MSRRGEQDHPGSADPGSADAAEFQAENGAESEFEVPVCKGEC